MDPVVGGKPTFHSESDRDAIDHVRIIDGIGTSPQLSEWQHVSVCKLHNREDRFRVRRHSGGNRGDRANAPHRWPVLRPADLPHVTGGKGTYQELSTQRVSVPKVHRILIRQVIVGQFVKLDESGGPIPHRHDTHGT
jgi:hypothetical protein